jgi:polyhydroxybutyrate depolymerase
MSHPTPSLRPITALFSISFLLACSAGCSQSQSTPPSQGTGGSQQGGAIGSSGSVGSGGAVGSGGSVGTGGSVGAGGTTTGTGGSAPGSGGAKAGTGGTTVAAGGSTTSTGGSTSRGGTSGSSATGGSPATGGSGAMTGGTSGSGGTTTGPSLGGAGGTAIDAPDAGPTGGRGGSTATGGSAGGTGGAGGGGGATADAGTQSSGCGKTLTRPDRKTQQTIDIQGTTRYYLLNVPNFDNKTPLPLVFALHGYDMNNVALVDAYDFTAQSGNKAITVLPQGEGPAPGNVSHWGDQVLKSTWTANAANYAFMQTLKEDLASRYCIDPSRVFITGFSMGGMFTNSMACEHVDWFRGYAPVEGGGPNSCAKADAHPAVIIHQGSLDTIAKPSAGEGTRDFWTKQNTCSSTSSSIYTGCQSYADCDAPVIYCVGAWDHYVHGTARANIWTFFNSLK